ncbi:MAG: TRAP transporter small permease subunit [Rhizobiaceae bacterium]|nr:TRAP transporter small permease subunit [Rhizobiaceae bacterium]
MKFLPVIGAWLRRRAEDVIVLLLGSMFATFLIQIVFRYVLNLPLGWTIEYVTVAWLWGILFGYAFVLRREDIIVFDLLYNAVPDGMRRAMAVAANMLCIVIMAWSLPKAYDYVTFMKVERTAFLQMRFDLLFAIYIPFVLSIIVRSALDIWRALTGRELVHDMFAQPEAAGTDKHA